MSAGAPKSWEASTKEEECWGGSSSPESACAAAQSGGRRGEMEAAWGRGEVREVGKWEEGGRGLLIEAWKEGDRVLMAWIGASPVISAGDGAGAIWGRSIGADAGSHASVSEKEKKERSVPVCCVDGLAGPGLRARERKNGRGSMGWPSLHAWLVFLK